MVRSTLIERFAVALLALSVFSGCSGKPEASNRPELPVETTGIKVVVVGIDGATFKVLDPLLATGEAPNFARLIESGARAPLMSVKPMRSPALWTTLSTGREREVHGIEHFVVNDPEDGDSRVLVNSSMRRTLNVWDVLGAGGYSVGVAGWWATWPAEPVRGWLVSDRLTRSRWSEWSDGTKDQHVTFPAELADEMRPLVVDPMNPPMEEIRELIELTAAEEAELLAAERPVRGHGPGVLKFAYTNQRTYEEIALALIERTQPDFSAVFLIANDAISHTYWHLHEPDAFEGVNRETAERLGPVVVNMYRHNDRYLGKLLDLVDDSTVVFVVSDHGFRASGELPSEKSLESLKAGTFDTAEAGRILDDTVTIGQPGVHHPEGLLIAAGGPIVPGTEVGATIYDLVPTILILMGLPTADDLPGQVLEEIIDPAFLAEHPVRTLPTYERLVNRRALRQSVDDSTPDEERLEMLRSLGYLNG